jgi:acetylornithine/succinyldiaminopimelate/putrescine aminotransferase
VAAMVAAPTWQDTLAPGKHGCTMGGNPLCAAAGVAVMKLIERENLLARAVKKGEEITRAIRGAKLARVKEVRGAGLMLGIELNNPGKDVFQKCMERGLLINVTQETVIRLAPPLIVPDDLIARALDILIGALKE